MKTIKQLDEEYTSEDVTAMREYLITQRNAILKNGDFGGAVICSKIIATLAWVQKELS